MKTRMALEEIRRLMWAGDVGALDELAGCVCCCHEHTFEHCPARVWEGCRGQDMPTRADIASWMKHYDMTASEFYGSSA